MRKTNGRSAQEKYTVSVITTNVSTSDIQDIPALDWAINHKERQIASELTLNRVHCEAAPRSWVVRPVVERVDVPVEKRPLRGCGED